MRTSAAAPFAVDPVRGTARDRLAALCDDFAGNDTGRSVAVGGLPDVGDIVGVRIEDARPGASVLKLPLVATVLAHAHAGLLDLTTTVAVRSLQASQWPGVVDALAGDTLLSLYDLCSLSIVTSDNPCADFLCRLVGLDAVNRWMRTVGCSAESCLAAGYGDDDIARRGRHNILTAVDAVVLLRRVYAMDYLRPLRHFLCNSVRNQRIPRFLDDGTVVAHKTGSLAGVVNDVGVIELAKGPVIAVFLCQNQLDVDAAEGDVARTARAICQAI
jgi:beta-lactamase class A